jgi:hypothetical protein
MATGDPIRVGNVNRGDVGFGDATILSADPSSALDCVLYVEPTGKRAGNGIIGRSWSATPSGGWALQAAGDLVWSDGLLSFGRTAIMAQGNQFGAIVAGDDAVTANGRLAGVRARAPGPDDHGEVAGVGVASTGGLTGVDATGGTTGVAGRGGSVGVQGESAQGTAVHGVSQTGTGVAAQGAIGVASEASGTAVQATATGDAGSTAVSAVCEQGTAVRAWSNAGRALDARSEVGDALYVTARRMGLAAWSEQASGVVGSCGGPNPLNIVRAGVMGTSDAYPGVLGQSDTGTGVEAVSRRGAALRARADGGGTGVYATAGVNPATGTPGLPLLVEATRTGVTQLPHAAQFVGHVEVSGDLIVVGGAKSAAVVAPDGGHRRVYCTEMPEAWIEDAGEAELVDGVAEVAIDERLAAIADVEGYQVFLSPYAPVRAYVGRRDPGSFEIRLAGKKRPKKPVACGWRLLARRRDVTAERFAPYIPVAEPAPAGEPAPLERLDLERPIVEPHARLAAPDVAAAAPAPECPPMPQPPPNAVAEEQQEPEEHEPDEREEAPGES